MIYDKDGKIDWEANQKQNDDRANNPHIGDYWQEMFMPVLVVLGRPSKDSVMICKETKVHPTDKKCKTWNLEKSEVMSIADFSRYLHYDSDSMKHKCWCDCEPECMKHIREAAIEAIFGKEA